MSTQVALPTEAEIATLMEQFYRKVERDDELAPIFAPVLAEPSSHVEEMTDFWTAALRGDAKPAAAANHPPHPIAPVRFQRWLALFRATAADVLGPTRGLSFLDRAERIATSLQVGLFKTQDAEEHWSELHSAPRPQRPTIRHCSHIH